MPFIETYMPRCSFDSSTKGLAHSSFFDKIKHWLLSLNFMVDLFIHSTFIEHLYVLDFENIKLVICDL